MNSPEPLNRLSVFRRLGSYLGQQWGLGIQVVTDGVASRPLAIGDGFALSAFHEECISITALNDEHDASCSSLSAVIEIHSSWKAESANPSPIANGRDATPSVTT